MASKSSPTSKEVHEERNDFMKDLVYRDGWVELHFVGNTKKVDPVGLPDGNLIATLGGYSLYSGDGEPRPPNKKFATLTRSDADVICKLLASGIYCMLIADSGSKRPSDGFMVKYTDWVTAQHQLKTCDIAAMPALQLEAKTGFSHSVGVLRLYKRTKLTCTHIFYRPWASHVWSITAGQVREADVHEADVQPALHDDASKIWRPTSFKTFPLDQKHKRLLLISFFSGFWRSQNLIKNSKECAQTIGDLLGDSSIRPSAVSADLAEAGCRPLSPSLALRLFRELIAEARSLLSKRTRPVSRNQTFVLLLAMVEPELFSSELLKDFINKD